MTCLVFFWYRERLFSQRLVRNVPKVVKARCSRSASNRLLAAEEAKYNLVAACVSVHTCACVRVSEHVCVCRSSGEAAAVLGKVFYCPHN